MSMMTRILVVVAVLAGGVCVGYWMERNVPSESNRVRHPQGYSICHPEDWSAEMNYAMADEQFAKAQRLDGLSMSPDHFDGMPPQLFVNRFAAEPDPEALRSDGWTDGSFQGQPALVREKKLTRGWTRGAVFARSGQWFDVVEMLSVPGSIQKDEWWPFLETFRYPDGPLPAATAARILPASAPASTEPFHFPALGQ
jgi:hypothetical protein